MGRQGIRETGDRNMDAVRCTTVSWTQVRRFNRTLRARENTATPPLTMISSGLGSTNGNPTGDTLTTGSVLARPCSKTIVPEVGPIPAPSPSRLAAASARGTSNIHCHLRCLGTRCSAGGGQATSAAHSTRRIRAVTPLLHRGHMAEMFDDGDEAIDGVIDFVLGGEAAEAESHVGRRNVAAEHGL